MKYIFTILSWIFLLSCVDPDAESRKFNYQLDSLNYVLNVRDSVINDLLSAFNEVEQNLRNVSSQQRLISSRVLEHRTEISPSVKELLNEQIAGINILIGENRKKIEKLRIKLQYSSTRISEFQNMQINLNKEIAEKNLESRNLNTALNRLSIHVIELQETVDTLAKRNSRQAKIISSQLKSSHAACYLVGTAKQLEQEKVIDHRGGFLGIGRTPVLSSNFGGSSFKMIDYTHVTSIDLNASKFKIITTHPSNSYLVEKANGKFHALRITDPEKFWSLSRYLVIITQ